MMMMMMMMMMLEDDSSVSKKCQESLGSPVASEKTGEKGLFILFFENCPWKIQTFCEYMRIPNANFEIINFYTLGRRHVEF